MEKEVPTITKLQSEANEGLENPSDSQKVKVPKQWYVYLLECQNNSVYTGITNDLPKRMQAHKNGTGSKYVRAKGFKELLHVIKAENKSVAAKLEYKLKQLVRNDKITFFMEHEDLQF